jgi:hypothetical protein
LALPNNLFLFTAFEKGGKPEHGSIKFLQLMLSLFLAALFLRGLVSCSINPVKVQLDYGDCRLMCAKNRFAEVEFFIPAKYPGFFDFVSEEVETETMAALIMNNETNATDLRFKFLKALFGKDKPLQAQLIGLVEDAKRVHSLDYKDLNKGKFLKLLRGYIIPRILVYEGSNKSSAKEISYKGRDISLEGLLEYLKDLDDAISFVKACHETTDFSSEMKNLNSNEIPQGHVYRCQNYQVSQPEVIKFKSDIMGGNGFLQ